MMAFSKFLRTASTIKQVLTEARLRRVAHHQEVRDKTVCSYCHWWTQREGHRRDCPNRITNSTTASDITIVL